MPVLVRYTLLQLPGWTIASGILYLAWTRWDLSGLLALGGLAFWISKDFALYPFVRSAYAVGPSSLIGPELLLGSEGTSDGELTPSGHVRLRGERWRAESTSHVAAGARVRVRAVRGLTVEVEPICDGDEH
jgi:membrane-bound serine protease (ClpP class)